MYIVGVGDDLIGVSYKWKFVAQIICGILIAISGLWMHSLGNFFGFDNLPKWLGYLATIFVVVYITNAFNLIDGIDASGNIEADAEARVMEEVRAHFRPEFRTTVNLCHDCLLYFWRNSAFLVL